eukprot:4047637-Amphidinium_carterae.1
MNCRFRPQGTFEIGELPQTDSVLLLVLERRDARTSLVGFQSFAFPIHGEDEVTRIETLRIERSKDLA